MDAEMLLKRRLAASREEKRELMRELAEARKQWRMPSVCRDLASQRNRLLAALQGVMDYRQGKPPYDFHQYGEAERDNMAHDAWQVIEQNCMSLLAEIEGSTSHTPDINAIGDQFIGQVLAYYEGYSKDELTQVFARGPFAGMSERELYELVKHWDDNRKVVRLEPNADK